MIAACNCQCCQRNKELNSLVFGMHVQEVVVDSPTKDLEEKLAQAEQNVIDFERIAHTWKKSYGEQEKKYKRLLGDRETTIEELEKEIKELKKASRD